MWYSKFNQQFYTTAITALLSNVLSMANRSWLRLSLLTLTVLTVACAPLAVEVIPDPTATSIANSITCDEINKGMSLYRDRVAILSQRQNKKAASDATVVSFSILTAFILSPSLILLTSKSYAQELASAKTNYLQLAEMQYSRRCTVRSNATDNSLFPVFTIN